MEEGFSNSSLAGHTSQKVPLALQESWRQLMLTGLLPLLLADALAWVLGSRDFWDTRIDPWLHLVTCLTLLLAWVLIYFRRITVPQATLLLLLGCGTVFLAKLGLLLLMLQPTGVVMREVSQSLLWFPVLLTWTMITEIVVPLRRAMKALVLGCGVLTVLGLGLNAWAGQLNRDLLSTVLELNLALFAVLYGVSYFLKRADLLGRWQGERKTLTYLAYHDLLTGLPGRMSLERDLAQLLGRTPHTLALLFIDLDSFKIINDTLGHAVGDRLLSEVGGELERLCADLTPPPGAPAASVYRLSGDEFVVLLPGVNGKEAEQLGRQWQVQAAAQPSQNVGVDVTLSIGVSACPEDAEHAPQLLRHADSAMYAVKRSGRRGVRRYHPQQDAATERFQVLARDLSLALSQGQLHLAFQPVFRLSDMQMVKVEALLRWQHPELGAVSPAEFIPIAEQVGLMAPLGFWVLRHACRAAQAWPSLAVSVNVSAVQLIGLEFAQQVWELLNEEDFEAQRLELELTETALLHEDERAISAVNALRGSGVRVVIDDFGSGYSNLARLRRLPLSGVKLDRSFIANLLSDHEGEYARALTQAAVGIAQSLGVPLTAEGIESPQHLRVVRELGCQLGQGYGLSRPVSTEGVSRQLAAGPLLSVLDELRYAPPT